MCMPTLRDPQLASSHNIKHVLSEASSPTVVRSATMGGAEWEKIACYLKEWDFFFSHSHVNQSAK